MKIIYIISHGVAEWVDFDHSGGDTLALCFKPKFSGALSVGDRTVKVTDGEASLAIRLIKDGEHHPRLECNGGIFDIAGFIKSGNTVEPIDNGGATVRRLVKELYELSEDKREQEERIARLEQICKGHSIFNF